MLTNEVETVEPLTFGPLVPAGIDVLTKVRARHSQHPILYQVSGTASIPSILVKSGLVNTSSSKSDRP